jgi:hypothetical protein
MAEIVSERERRTRQFEHYLALMEHRALRVMKEDCFLIFFRRVPAALRQRVSAGMRFVQFAFHADIFFLDLPHTTLTPEEADQLIAERPGFHFVLKDPSRKVAEYELHFNPVQRIYQYSEKRQAAEDTAYLFFDLWKFPLGAWFKVVSQAFQSGKCWERKFSLG